MNELNVLKRICRHLFLTVLLCAMSATTASAQVPTVTVDAKNVTIKELLQRIEANSQYTFAYIDADINPDKRVSVKAVNRSIASIIAEVLPNVNMEVKGLKIVLTAKRGGESQTRPAADAGRTVKGRVTDESGAPVIGATVILKGTTVGTATNATGEYAIDIRQADAVLVYSLIGYNKVEVALSEGQTQADVTLKSEAIAMDNVVVVGYGVQNKRDVTTAISSIKAEDFAAMPTADFRDAMAAKMPGVQVLTLGGQPDGNVSIRIRGIQSATSGNDPLYVIDGVPCDARAFSNLESSDIESLEVLKDASAAAIYGSRGSCGVILITTKRGEGERPVVSYDGQFSVSSVSKTIDMLNAYEFAKIFKEARDGAYLFNVPTGSIDDPYEDRPQTYHRVDPLITAYLQDKTGTMTDTDWQDAIFRTAYSTKHSVSVSGRTKTLGYYIGANYLYREGTIIGSDFERYSLRANIDGKRNRLKYGVSFSPSYSKTNYISSDTQYGDDGVIASALMAPPVFPVYNTDGSYNWCAPFMPDGGIHALSGLRSFLRAPPVGPRKRSAAGQDTSSSVPVVVPDGGINALSGLRSFLRDPTPGPASAAPPGSQTRALVASSILYLWLNRRAMRSSFIINSSVTPTSTMVSAEPSAILPRSVRLKMVTGSVVQPGG